MTALLSNYSCGTGHGNIQPASEFLRGCCLGLDRVSRSPTIIMLAENTDDRNDRGSKVCFGVGIGFHSGDQKIRCI